MRYKILDSVQVKRTRYELLEDGQGKFIVSKTVGCKVDFLYSSKNHELAYKFYERTIGAR
jgi:hypothetical protein